MDRKDIVSCGGIVKYVPWAWNYCKESQWRKLIVVYGVHVLPFAYALNFDLVYPIPEEKKKR